MFRKQRSLLIGELMRYCCLQWNLQYLIVTLGIKIFTNMIKALLLAVSLLAWQTHFCQIHSQLVYFNKNNI